MTLQNPPGIPPIINVDPRPDSVDGDSNKKSFADHFTAALHDYVALYCLNSPRTTKGVLTRERLCRMLPLAFTIYVAWVFLFLIVEVSGGAGGTSSLAETRTATLFMIYFFFMLPLSFYIAKVGNDIQTSCVVTTFALLSIILLAAEIGSVFATFGVCGESQTQCGIDSKNRGAKNVLETIFYLIFGIPPLVAAFQAALEIEMENRMPLMPLHRLASTTPERERSIHKRSGSMAGTGSSNPHGYGTVMHKAQSLPTPVTASAQAAGLAPPPQQGSVHSRALGPPLGTVHRDASANFGNITAGNLNTGSGPGPPAPVASGPGPGLGGELPTHASRDLPSLSSMSGGTSVTPSAAVSRSAVPPEGWPGPGPAGAADSDRGSGKVTRGASWGWGNSGTLGGKGVGEGGGEWEVEGRSGPQVMERLSSGLGLGGEDGGWAAAMDRREGGEYGAAAKVDGSAGGIVDAGLNRWGRAASGGGGGALQPGSSFVLGHLPRLPTPSSRAASSAMPPPDSSPPLPPSMRAGSGAGAPTFNPASSLSSGDAKNEPAPDSDSPAVPPPQVDSQVDSLINQFLDADQNDPAGGIRKLY